MSSLVPRSDRLRFGILCLLGYVALAWAVRFDLRLGGQIASLVYPLDTFSMYARPAGHDTSILLARTADGGVHAVTEFRQFACDAPVLGPTARCIETRGIPYHYEDLARWVEQHPGTGELEVELVTRTWRVGAGSAVEVVGDCLVARCRAAR